MILTELKLWLDEKLSQVVSDRLQRQAERNLILKHFWAITPEMLLTSPELEIPEDATWLELQALIVRRLDERMPIQYLLGQAYFYGHVFSVSPAVLIPRPETELLVSEVLSEINAQRYHSVLDLGTGSGCIAISLKLACPELSVKAVDVSPEALKVARKNAEALGADVCFVGGSWYEPVASETFDVIVSNPPYIDMSDRNTLAPEVLQEPEAALFPLVKPLRLYQYLMARAQYYLNPGGVFLAEMGMGQHDALLSIANELGMEARSVKDYGGIGRILVVRPVGSP